MEPSGNTETEDGTVAAAKKTARRVSFADTEITSVHLFPTDDANDSDQTPPINSAVEKDHENDVVSSPFLKSIASSSPSSTDNEEEAFRAPVSASFIAPGRFSGSDSGFSDDLTMDSTAFSLHYRSIIRSDSTDFRTPSQTSIPTATGSLMTLTKAKNQLSSSSVSNADSASGARDSNYMSVVEGDENPFRYDYHEISPSLDAILAERSKDARSGLESANMSGCFSAKGNETSTMTRSPSSLISSVLKRKNDESPAKGVIVSNGIQEAPTPTLTFLQARLSDLRRGDIVQDLYRESNSDGKDFGAEISFGKKRKDYEIQRGGDRVDGIGMIDTSPQLHKIRKCDQPLVLQGTSDMRSENEKLGDQTSKTWTDTVKDFSWSTKQLLSPSVDMLNLRAIGVLEDILVQLQKVNICEAFCSEIHSQKIADKLNNCRHKRFAEARSLLFNIAYEKAKLQLMHIKLERLTKISQLSSEIQKFQMKKLNGIPSKQGAVDSQANDRHFRSLLLGSEGKFLVSSCEKVTTMRQELETLDWKAKSLNKSFHAYFKMENNLGLADTTIYIRDYLKKRISCKLILQNLQLWDIADFEHVDGCYRVVFEYYGYVIQRFTVSDCPSPSIIISNELNDENIVKTFPDLDAFIAFMFVFNPHTTKKYTDPKGLAQETQVTVSLLSNLLDVIEEVQLARIETRNMIHAKFYSESVGQLDLLLSFIDFCSGRKVKVTLDMTCLRCGVYPVETLPYRIHDPASGEHKSSSLVAEIRTSLKSLSFGYSRIMRLCRCISKAVQGCTLSL